ncbi:MAG: hypothetical protein JXR70_06010 [Spirochaetales bacterium]|nr:hypothetical protein [Spirochaetales bacterium]
MKRISKFFIALIKPLSIPASAFLLLVILYFTGYVVVPEGLEFGKKGSSKGWNAMVTEIESINNGMARIHLAIRNDTGAFSAMKAVEGRAAVITHKDGKTVECPSVFVGTGGHRVAPDFYIQGYQLGNKYDSRTQRIYVECASDRNFPESKLTINYSYVTGQYNYYEPEANQIKSTLVVDLDNMVTNITYPLAKKVSADILQADFKISALNQVVLTLADYRRDEKGIQFTWQTRNPGEYQTYVHIGTPPVIGSDGVIYGFYVSPDLPSTPITPPGKTTEWTTFVAVPETVNSLYILLSVESGKQRLFANYAVDISKSAFRTQ